jgi:hypothetical protein
MDKTTQSVITGEVGKAYNKMTIDKTLNTKMIVPQYDKDHIKKSH